MDLKEALANLVEEATRYPGRRDTLLPDIALYGFVTDVREHAIAVDMISTSASSRAAFTNARAALESAVDAAFLSRDENQYLYRGAQARVAELFEIHELESRALPFDPPLPVDAPARMHPEDAIAADAKAWDEDAPGRGSLLRGAWETFTQDPGAVRKHWSLLSKDELYQTVFTDEDDEVLGGMARVIHALLSMASHPRMRVGSRDIEFDEDGGVLLRTRATDADMARRITALACIVATSALQRRRGFFVQSA